MPDHTNPDSTSQGRSDGGMQCSDFDLLLTDALDGVLTGASLSRFQVHGQTCSLCGPLLVEVDAGRKWLKDLAPVEPPFGLVENILVSTSGIATSRLRANVSATPPRVSWLERVQAWISGNVLGAMEPIWATVKQPRFAMSFGMAFFSLSVALSVAGVKPTDLRQVSLRPAALRHTYYSTQARVVRYYENIRLVYEVESRVREFKRDVRPAEPGPAKQKDHKNDTTQQPEQQQERNYSQFDNHVVMASAPVGPTVSDLPVVSVSTYRRFV
jgi:hypothetical protein